MSQARHAGRHELPKPQPLEKVQWYRARWLGLPILVWMLFVVLVTSAIAVVAWLGALNFSGTAETDGAADLRLTVLTEAVVTSPHPSTVEITADIVTLSDGNKTITVQWPAPTNGQYLRMPYSLSGHHARAVIQITNNGQVPAVIDEFTFTESDAFVAIMNQLVRSDAAPEAAHLAQAEAAGKAVLMTYKLRGQEFPFTLAPGASISSDWKIAFTDLALPGTVYDLGTGSLEY